MLYPVVLTDDPDAGAPQTVPIQKAIQIARTRYRQQCKRVLPERDHEWEWRGYQAAIPYFERGSHVGNIAKQLGLCRWRVKKYHRRWVQSGSGIISEGPNSDPPKTQCEVLG